MDELELMPLENGDVISPEQIKFDKYRKEKENYKKKFELVREYAKSASENVLK